MPEIKLWGALRSCVDDAHSVDIDAKTIRELFNKLAERYPCMVPFIESGISVAINGEIYRDSWHIKLPVDAEIYLLPRIEGG